MTTDDRLLQRQKRRANVAWMVFAILAAFYLWTEHQAHLLGILPYLLLLACPLMHLFMHHGHKHHHDGVPAQRPGDEKGGPK